MTKQIRLGRRSTLGYNTRCEMTSKVLRRYHHTIQSTQQESNLGYNARCWDDLRNTWGVTIWIYYYFRNKKRVKNSFVRALCSTKLLSNDRLWIQQNFQWQIFVYHRKNFGASIKMAPLTAGYSWFEATARVSLTSCSFHTILGPLTSLDSWCMSCAENETSFLNPIKH